MTLLETKGLTKRFGGLTAVAELDFRVERGSITSLIGPNGAGKTTVFNVITGVYRADGGSVQFADRNITNLKQHEIAALGIGRTFQNLRLFPPLSALENVVSGQHTRSKAGVLSSDRKSTRLNSSHVAISYAVFCLKKKKNKAPQ